MATIELLRTAFGEYDVEGNGAVSPAEFAAILADMEVEVDEVDALLGAAGVSAEEDLTWSEFLVLMYSWAAEKRG
jgi:Ca2+-binding EF-hand superfamily protein